MELSSNILCFTLHKRCGVLKNVDVINGYSILALLNSWLMILELSFAVVNGIVGWWNEQGTKKIMPIKRVWSEEECLAMR